MRERSLMQDKNDDAGFRHGRERHVGCIASEFGQSVPMFFSREGATIDLIGQYKGGSAFLICNGPSFAQLDHSLLRQPGIMVFGMNNGPRTFRPDFWTCVDDPSRFIKSIWLDPRITKFVPQAHFEKCIFDNGTAWAMTNIRVGDCPNVIGYRRNEKFVANRFFKENTLNWGCHKDFGGSRSVMLPAIRILHILGFRKIYLLGCDMNMSETYTYHFDEKRDKGAVNCNMSTYQRLKEEYLPQLKPYLEEEGVQVFNCNPDSALKVFPFKSYEDAINETIAPLGDVKNERTYAMYSKPGTKDEFKVEPPPEQKKNLVCLKKGAKPNDIVAIKPPVNTPAVSKVEIAEEMPCDDDDDVDVAVSSATPVPKQVTISPPQIKVNQAVPKPPLVIKKVEPKPVIKKDEPVMTTSTLLRKPLE